MNCDDVFFALTRGPFPSGHPDDVTVEIHLENCADCWRFAQALRPAMEIFQEAVPAIEGRDLPGYWGDSRPPTAALMEVSDLATRTLVAARRRVARPIAMPQLATDDSVGWREVLQVGSFVAVLATLVIALAILVD
jgi:hypothetical protein